RLTVSRNVVPLGGMVDLGWELRGRIDRIGTLTIELKGREEATYRRGTTTHTDAKEFFKLPIAEITDVRDMGVGKTSFTVPTDTIHSFEAENNKIVWSLVVHGDIAYWPDVNDEFDFKVLPYAPKERGL
ncbi:unnamed protein product, partial [marine sediment metagenome]